MGFSSRSCTPSGSTISASRRPIQARIIGSKVAATSIMVASACGLHATGVWAGRSPIAVTMTSAWAKDTAPVPSAPAAAPSVGQAAGIDLGDRVQQQRIDLRPQRRDVCHGDNQRRIRTRPRPCRQTVTDQSPGGHDLIDTLHCTPVRE